MKKFILAASLFIASISSNAWELTENNIRAFIEWSDNQRKIYEPPRVDDGIKDKYWKSDRDIDEKDFAALARLVNNQGAILYINGTVELFDNFQPNIKDENHLKYFDSITDALDDFAKNMKELAQKIRSREIKNNVGRYISDIELLTEYRMEDAAKKIRKIFEENRDVAKNDVIAQVLNYSSEMPEDASGNSFFYPDKTNGQCIYRLAEDKRHNPKVFSMDRHALDIHRSVFASFMINNINQRGEQPDSINLKKGNLENINFYQLHGRQYGSAYLKYQSKIDGLPNIFLCDSNSCNINRLKRGWSLVASRCKGVQKPF